MPIVCDLGITDDYATLLHLDCALTSDLNTNNTIVKINYYKLASLSSNVNWAPVYSDNDVKKTTSAFIDKLENILKLSKKTSNKKKKNLPRKDWISRGLMKSCRIKNELYKKIKKKS